MIIGTAFSDEIVGTGIGETIYGGGGADVIDGEGGGGADRRSLPRAASNARRRDTRTSKVSVGFMTPPGATPYAQLYLVGSSGNDSITATYSPAEASPSRSPPAAFDQSASDAGWLRNQVARPKRSAP